MRFKKSEANVAEVDMTPMIDIVFQLIAFFMVVTNFEQLKADERVKLPRDPLAQPPKVKKEHELVVNLGYVRNTEGDITDETPYVFHAGEKLTVEGFAPRLKREATLFRDEGTSVKEVNVTIRADGEVPTGIVQELIKHAQEAQFEQFSLKATKSSD